MAGDLFLHKGEGLGSSVCSFLGFLGLHVLKTKGRSGAATTAGQHSGSVVGSGLAMLLSLPGSLSHPL